jgi:hypothetical protein
MFCEKQCFKFSYQFAISAHRKPVEIRPEDFSISYRCHLLHDLGSKELSTHRTTRNATAGAASGTSKNRRSDFLKEIWKKIEITIDAIHDEKDSILTLNFTAIGSIMLEFVDALSDHMGWSRMIEDTLRKKQSIRLFENQGANFAGGINASVLQVKRIIMSHLIGDLLLCVDRDYASSKDWLDINKVSEFTKSIFRQHREKALRIFR